MKQFRTLAAALAVLTFASVAKADLVAITEFMNNANGEDNGREWVELFNYGATSVDVSGWTLNDEDTDSFTIPNGTTIPSGGYLILVSGGSGGISAADAKATFEAEWLGGAADARVIGMESYALGNSGDELVLSDAGANLVWSLAYMNDETEAVATYHTSADLSGVANVYGSKAAPGVVRAGDDNGSAGFLGYEDSDLGVSQDPFGYASDIAPLAGLGWEDYSGVTTAGFGSPLAGGYTVVPEPATMTLFVVGGIALIRRRK
ncbi:MAG TPA: lamin tail domain-containing protein [Phycisphaerae bacterium]|nr:lamin tail domain-containing protein [Phycisphaerae bacterium]HRW55703.1 lamin tail domain-containing protein [Phycisphaerae bacterium]